MTSPAEGNGWQAPFACTGCGRPYPADRLVPWCPACGGIYAYSAPLEYAPAPRSTPGLGRFRRSLPLPLGADLVTLGEGDTPLLSLAIPGGKRQVHFKCEHLNPTGSFKDRGASILISVLLAAGAREVFEDSSGNAGASLAAYAARAGIAARVFVPEAASGVKRAQIAAYGATLVPIPGPRSVAAEEARREVDRGALYASHVYLPHGLAGMATIAFELVEQLGRAPGAVVAPVGHGSLVLGLHLGFQSMCAAGVIDRMPRLIGVQALACAPIWAVSTSGAAGLGFVREGATLAEGVRILHPVRGDAVLAAVEGSGGAMEAVAEDEIAQAQRDLARVGLLIEPTSALVWPAALKRLDELDDPVVAVLTGSGFKAMPV